MTMSKMEQKRYNYHYGYSYYGEETNDKQTKHKA